MHTNSLSGYIYALTAVFFWSINLIIASSFATSLMPTEIAFGRWLVAGIILMVIFGKDVRQSIPELIRHWKLVVALAVTGMVLDNTLIYYAGRTASAINMGLLDVTGPIFLVLLSRMFLKTPINGRQWLGLAIALFGVFIIILNGNITHLENFQFVPGDFIMLLNTFSFAVYSFLQYKRPQQISQPVMLTASAVCGAVILLPLMLLTTPARQFYQFNGEDMAVILYLGAFNSVLSYLAWNNALAAIGNIKTSIIYYLLPLFSGIEAYLFLGEKLYSADFIGGIMVIGGIALVNLKTKKA